MLEAKLHELVNSGRRERELMNTEREAVINKVARLTDEELRLRLRQETRKLNATQSGLNRLREIKNQVDEELVKPIPRRSWWPFK